jgi:large repetitive protein
MSNWKKIQLKVCFVGAIVLCIPLILISYSSNPPLARTGAPSESTCASCHSGGAGGGRVTIGLSGTTYTPGTKQRLTVTVSDPVAVAYGYELTAVQVGATSTGAGTFAAADGNSSVRQGTGTNSTKSYAAQMNNAVSTFAIDWTPPATNVGNVTLYISSVAGDGNQGSTDSIYNSSVTLTPAAAAATLSVSPTSLTFSYTQKGSTPAAQTVAISSSTALSYSLATSATWLSVSPNSGSTPGSVSVSVNPSGLTPGSYSGSVTVTATGASNSTITVPVSLTVVAAPSLTVSSTSLSFSAQTGGSAPSAQSVGVSSSGSALSYTAVSSATWLTATPASGTTPGSLSVAVNPAGLAAGTYNGTITVTAAGAANSPQTVGVTLNVTMPPPNLTVSPSTLTFTYQTGGTLPSAQAVAVSGSGATMNYAATTSATWLNATPASGTTPGSLSVGVSPTGLAVGSYTGTVTVTGAGAANNPQTVSVSLNVTAAPSLMLTPATLAFSYQVGGSTPATQSVSVASSGIALSYTVATSAAWLTASPASGTTPGTVTVGVNPTGLSVGTYTGTVSITASGAPSKTAAVTLTVTAAPLPTLSASPASLTYTYQMGGSMPAAQTVAFSSGGTAVNYTTSTSATWLSVTPGSGTTPGNLNVSVNPSSLTAGTYTGNVTVTSSGASNSPRTIPVTLTVTAAPAPTMTVSPLNLSFSYQRGGATPTAQSVNVTSTSAVAYTAAGSAGWLSVAPATGNTPGSLSVSVNPSGLAAGTYTGTVTVSASGASNSPQKVAVTLAVGAAPPATPSLNVTPGTVSFSYAAGSTTSGIQNLAVTSTGAVLSITAASSGAAWLTVTPTTGLTPSTLKISANPTGLAAGTYDGTITITSNGAANTPQTVLVKLVVTGTSSGTLRVWPSRAVSLEYETGHADPSPRTVRVVSSGAPLGFTAAAHGGTWVSVTPSGGTTPGSLSISVDPTGLAPGTYTANVYIAAQGSTGVTLPVILRVVSGDDGGGGGDDSSLHAWPYAYDPASSNTVAASWMDGMGAASSATATTDPRNQGLVLSKTSAASSQAQAGVVMRDVEGVSLTVLGYDIRQGGQCTAKSPRFVVVTSDDVVHKIGCATGIAQAAPAAGWKRLRFDSANSAQTSPAIAPGTRVKSIYLVLDDGPETGSSIVVLDNINVNGKVIGEQ